jgi:DNA-binding NarL/FixJ family response regulator
MTRPGPIAVLLVDDHPLVRQGLRAVLSAADDITVAGEAGDGDSAVALAAELRPDVSSWTCSCPGGTVSRPPGRS